MGAGFGGATNLRQVTAKTETRNVKQFTVFGFQFSARSGQLDFSKLKTENSKL